MNKKDMRIYILGFMGSGKSTFGKQLAHYAKCPFIDLDKHFEKTYHTSILDFFTHHTESEFREKEAALLRASDFPAQAVISLGGGTPCFYDNMDWLLKDGLCVYLKLSPKGLQYRLLHSKKQRPLLQGKSPEELLTYIDTLLQEREKYYEQAHLIIPGIILKSAHKSETFRRIMNV